MMTQSADDERAGTAQDHAHAAASPDDPAQLRADRLLTRPGSADRIGGVELGDDPCGVTLDAIWRRHSAQIFDPGDVYEQMRLLAAGDDDETAHLSSEDTTRFEKLRWLSRQSARKPVLFGTVPMREQLSELTARCPGFVAVTALVDRAVALSIMTGTPLSLPPLLLAGPPGIGKTHFAKSLAAVLGVPTHAWSCATNSDAMQLITGHPTSWRGARMGLLTEAIVTSGSANPVVLLDEIDKFVTHRDEQPYNILLNVLESENAEALLDEYLRVRFDVSRACIVATANDVSVLPDFIRDRFLIVRIVSPTGADLLALTRQIAAKIITPLGLPMPGDTVIVALARHHPRRIARVLRLALGFAAAQGRDALVPADVAAADALASAQAAGPSIGFIRPRKETEADRE
ncbi:AAA family ATPase [Methylobacterium brachiatum]|jgi:ATP-dependent Lon protease|uniref:AAA family ATPase n=1 Tax=Methylobacterium brachiatum TaxID=269660 RepID=UPI000EFCD515|nr:AAA family ATPase [Methylobacterium brachiatum]AYO86466.1 AAA family ATPase [Methylobacterium brachiatum]